MLKQTERAVRNLRELTDKFVVLHDSALDVCNSSNNAILPSLEVLVPGSLKEELLGNMEFVEHKSGINNLGNEYVYDIAIYKDSIYYIYTRVAEDDYYSIAKHTINKYDITVPEPKRLLEYYLDYAREPIMLLEQRAYLSLLVYFEELSDEEIGVYYRYVRTP